ncbi:hypothetical protein [Mycoplasmopsis columbinasalis]|uniref:hypothetical protein n=1 Tax=Mycoplasmopsis columbinasalis TaxID=114880 RepID=UPI00101CB604|nr:hypothetical protein [Mycoplasmopsis columbinasalis]
MQKLKTSVIIYGFSYYGLNIATYALTLFTGIIGTIFLAGASSYLNPNPYKSWLNANSSYIITITIVNSLTSLCTGLLSFFVVNLKYQEKMLQLSKMKFEYIFYLNRQGYYLNLTPAIATHLFYKRVLVILNLDRYKRDFFEHTVLDENFTRGKYGKYINTINHKVEKHD